MTSVSRSSLFALLMVAMISFASCNSAYNQRQANLGKRRAKENLTKAKSVERKGKKDRESNLKTTRKVQRDQHDDLNASSKQKKSKNKISSTGAFLIY